MKPIAVVVEDEQNLATIFQQALEMAGYTVEIWTDGASALERLSSKQHPSPHLITLDLHLPELMGEDVLAELKRDPRLDQCRIILTTADARLGDYLRDQVDLLLIKPIRFSQLRDLAERLLPSQ